MPTQVVVLGFPAAGKSSWTAQHLPRHHRLNRDTEGGRLDDLLPPLSAALAAGRDVVLDNTYATRAARAPLLALAKQHGARARCVWIDASIEDAQVNAVTRMVRAHGKLPSPAEIKTLAKRDPGVYGPGALFAYRKAFEPPTPAFEVRCSIQLSYGRPIALLRIIRQRSRFGRGQSG